MENLIIHRKITRNFDGSYHVKWFPLNEEIENLVEHGRDFSDKSSILDYELTAHKEIETCVNLKFEKPFYQVNADSIEQSLYAKRREDGVKAVDLLMSELRNTSLRLNLPEQVNRHIETVLDPIKKDVESGWWKSASDKIKVLEPDNILTKELISKIKTTIDNYIIENYRISFI